MYRQLQEKVKDHVIDTLCQISDKWKFDINDDKKDEPVIMGYGPDGQIIRAPIERLHLAIPEELVNGMAELCGLHTCYVISMGGCMLLRNMIDSMFLIYGINIVHDKSLSPCFYVISKNGTKNIQSNVWSIYNSGEKTMHFVCPFWLENYWNCVINEQLVSPLLLLLDPILYFRRYSIIIQKYPQLGRKHTWGIYELLLEYFPEMNEDLFCKYWGLKYVFQDICVDITFLVGSALVGLYVCGNE